MLVLLVACTGETAPQPEPTGPPPTNSPSPEPHDVAVIASVTGPSSATDATYLDGMRLAEAEVNEAGGVLGRPIRLDVTDDRGEAALAETLLEEALGERPVAAFVIGQGSVVSAHRSRIEEAGGPVFLLSGDLYTSRELFRQTFQTGVPLRWQAAVMMRYLVVDRRYTRLLAVVEAGLHQRSAREAIEAASREEGSSLPRTLTLEPGGVLEPILQEASKVEAMIFFGGASETSRLAEALGALPDPPQLAASFEALSPEVSTTPPGTVAAYPYTWAGWADPIPRVGTFRARFEEALGRPPGGFEQEGYDAVRLVGDGLERSGGESSEALVRALQGFRERVYSSLPVRFGPDDRTAIDDSQLGLFAVPSPDESAEPWFTQVPRWRPLMRTFTFDGEKTNVLDRDKRVFFPRWRKPRPSPNYWRSRYGITTRPKQDLLH